jgi:TetR/AcrR family transcriptional repressor of nem operon
MQQAAHSGPGRPREFDIDTAVKAAIEVFRTHGYNGTSVHDLTAGTGLARGSLYKAFRDKHALFIAALEHYSSQSLQRLADDLGQSGSAREAIRSALMAFAKRASDGRCRGCLVIAAAMEMMPQDPEVSALISRQFRRIQDLFAAAVIRGQANGEIPPAHDERAIAQLLLCTIHGLRILGKTRPSEADTSRIVESVLRVLN